MLAPSFTCVIVPRSSQLGSSTQQAQHLFHLAWEDLDKAACRQSKRNSPVAGGGAASPLAVGDGAVEEGAARLLAVVAGAASLLVVEGEAAKAIWVEQCQPTFAQTPAQLRPPRRQHSWPYQQRRLQSQPKRHPPRPTKSSSRKSRVRT